jgi:putative oxidoreductase
MGTSGDVGLLVLRLVVGLMFFAHGAQKVFGWWEGPGLSNWTEAMERMGFRPAGFWGIVSALAELVAGLFLAAGLLTPLVSAVLVAQSIVIVVHAHLPKGFWNKAGGFEFPLVALAAVVALAGTGPGSLSLDTAFGLTYSSALRAILLIIFVVGALVALAIPRLAHQAAPQPR